MKKLTLATIALLFAAGLANGQDLPVPGVDPTRDVPGAAMLPDPEATHKVVIDIVQGAENIDDVNPMLNATARYVNTLARHGVPAENRQIAVVLHQGSTEIVLQNEAFKARNDGHDNPNIEMIRTLSEAGVRFHVCGQGVTGREIDPATILPEIQLDHWALTTLIDLQSQGYVLVGG